MKINSECTNEKEETKRFSKAKNKAILALQFCVFSFAHSMKLKSWLWLNFCDGEWNVGFCSIGEKVASLNNEQIKP